MCKSMFLICMASFSNKKYTLCDSIKGIKMRKCANARRNDFRLCISHEITTYVADTIFSHGARIICTLDKIFP